MLNQIAGDKIFLTSGRGNMLEHSFALTEPKDACRAPSKAN